MAQNNKGKKFEDIVKQSFLKTLGVSIDRLRDVSYSRVRGRTTHLKNVDNPSDFIVYKKPHEVYVECKSHKGNTLPFTCIRDEQIEGMMRKIQIPGVKAGILLWFIDHDLTVWIPIQEVVDWQIRGAKSINIKDLDYLKHIVVTGKKKRVYYEYDMNKFLEELYGDEAL